MLSCFAELVSSIMDWKTKGSQQYFTLPNVHSLHAVFQHACSNLHIDDRTEKELGRIKARRRVEEAVTTPEFYLQVSELDHRL